MTVSSDRLNKLFNTGTLWRPTEEMMSSVDLIRAIAGLCGVTGLPSSKHVARLTDKIGPSDHYVVILVDGMGMMLMDRFVDGSFLPMHYAGEMQAVFPSTTASALTSFATGRWPAAHGVTGWWMYLPESGVSTTTLHFMDRFTERPLDERGIRPDAVFTVPSLLPRFKHTPMSLSPDCLVNGVYARYSSGGTKSAGYASIPQGFALAGERIASATGPTFTYLYIPDVDGLVHEQGVDHPNVRRLMAALDSAIGAFKDKVGGAARIIVTADHGLMDIRQSNRIRLSDDDTLMRLLLCPPVGDPRTPCFHVKPGREREFEHEFHNRFDSVFSLVTPDEAQALDVFGPEPFSPVTRARLGTFLAIAEGPSVMYHKPTGHPETPHAAEHAGLDPSEMLVPLFLA